jgi:tetratricopeptide (TPR) repeat protein
MMVGVWRLIFIRFVVTGVHCLYHPPRPIHVLVPEPSHIVRRDILYRDINAVAVLPRTLISATGPSNELFRGVQLWISSEQTISPSKDDVAVLRNAFSELYGTARDLNLARELLSEAIRRWQSQPPDELAGLYRVRGDCYMLLGDASKAIDDYTLAVKLLDGPGGEKADQSELPSALLGRARSLKSLGRDLSVSAAKASADDYKKALELLSREDWESQEERIEDGSFRNPYAAWEWGSVLRLAGDWEQASGAHRLAATSFDAIGDKPRAAISLLDAGVDLAAASKISQAKSTILEALQRTKGVQSNDVSLLQRVVEKRGEARVALASLLWSDGNNSDAERLVSEACVEMEELLFEVSQRSLALSEADVNGVPRPLQFSIDDSLAHFPSKSFTCSKFRDTDFLSQLMWPEGLQTNTLKLLSVT